MNATLKDYRESSRERGKRYRDRLKAEGKRHVNLIVSRECHGVLMAEKERTGYALSTIIERAVLRSVNKNVTPEQDKNATLNATDPDRAELIEKIKALKVAGATHAEVADALNTEGVETPSGRGAWKKSTVDNLVRRSKG